MPLIGTASAWRRAARGFLSASIPPEDISWGTDTTQASLFDTPADPVPTQGITVPRRFLQLADTVVWHIDETRFTRLYDLLWRLRRSPGLLQDRADPGLAKLLTMEKNVHRCQHKMKAFVRFREVGTPTDPRRSFAAWFEPTHFTVEPTAGFFRSRFADMDWRIYTPGVSAFYHNGQLWFEEGQKAPELPQDASEALWVTYFRNIFNPARLKVTAMQSEMPKKYWKNMPEAAEIRDLIATAPARAQAMAVAAPTQPPMRSAKLRAQAEQHISAWSARSDLPETGLRDCTRCPLHRHATQVVPGEGPVGATLMIVGEQPGDQEDLQGRPFVGPAGQLLDATLQAAGLNRSEIYLTNAVKHFKYVANGRKRLHQRPNASEISRCRWWLEEEIKRNNPRLIVSLGATAASALTGNGSGIGQRRGQLETALGGKPVLISLHPAGILRTREDALRKRADLQLRQDLDAARRLVSQSDPLPLRMGPQGIEVTHSETPNLPRST
jgi:DNA polymerase